MDVCLQHVLISDNPHAAVWTVPDLTRGGVRRRALEKFDQFAQFREERAINWHRTFALRNLNYYDYTLFDRNRYGSVIEFAYRHNSDGRGAPNVVHTFEWDEAGRGSQQGDCIMCSHQKSQLCFEVEAEIDLDVLPECSLLFDDKYVTDFTRAQVLADHCFTEESRAIFISKIMDTWKERSFIFVLRSVF